MFGSVPVSLEYVMGLADSSFRCVSSRYQRRRGLVKRGRTAASAPVPTALSSSDEDHSDTEAEAYGTKKSAPVPLPQQQSTLQAESVPEGYEGQV